MRFGQLSQLRWNSALERPWAESHQYGTDRIPQREFAGIPADGLVEVVDIVADAAVEMLLRELEGCEAVPNEPRGNSRSSWGTLRLWAGNMLSVFAAT